MRLKSFLPWRVPSWRVSVLATPSGSVVPGGMFHMIQCVQVPTGASGSSAISASDWVRGGAPAQLNSGERSGPSHVYFLEIVPPLGNAVALIVNDIAPPPCVKSPYCADGMKIENARSKHKHRIAGAFVRAECRSRRIGFP